MSKQTIRSDVLHAVIKDNGSTLEDIIRRTELPKKTVKRYLKELIDCNYLIISDDRYYEKRPERLIG